MAIIKEPLVMAIGVYAAIHLLMIVVFGGKFQQIASGLMIDLRYVLFFVLVFVAVRLYPNIRPLFVKVGIAGALVVVIFGMLQVFVLPVDVLKYIGYDNVKTIAPYLTVDQNHDYIRINSTLRGPNPLGAYAVIILAALIAWFLKVRKIVGGQKKAVVAVLTIGSVIILWASYSRSALLAAVAALVVVAVGAARLVVAHRHKWILAAAGVVFVVAGIAVALNSSFISNVFLHENPSGDNSVNSNEGHLTSLSTGVERLVKSPFGSGIGSSGSASLFGDKPLIIENQYLLIANEVGWLGLALFVLIFIGIMSRLWTQRKDWLALGVFASGIGMAVIGLLLPVWVDDTVAIVWWGLAGVIIGARYHE
jgi:hypothetical protein